MSTALTATAGELLPAPDTLRSMMALAQQVHESGLSKAKSPAAVLAIMLTGRELGIPAMASLRLIHDVQGRPTLSAELMLSLILRDHGGDAMLVEATTDKVAEYSYRRRDWPAGQRRSHRYTIEEATKAGLTKNPTWQGHPAAMLRARCISAIARMAFPDTVMGLYTPDEAEEAGVIESSPRIVEMADGKRADTATGEVIDAPVPAPADPHAALRAEVTALLRTNNKVLAALEAQGKADTSTWTESALLAMRKRLRESERPTPRQALSEAEEIELAIEKAATLGEMDALLQRIAALPEGTAQTRLDAIHREKYERMADEEKAEPLPAFTAR